MVAQIKNKLNLSAITVDHDVYVFDEIKKKQ